ncbi:charged multivesicular body protein, putative [Entamoeba invadens IP1]|uniref:Charged multivesicular body protein, putative n=1 Tax=Entamoeba invadens IP1 TaxID=370355 RepID=A0A0A1UA15_ENTIV|nr:charged multivesicular body protein, putative [Entamoeba invadens IP1]ELP89991.1 charged multivesicular body protein, putative [Entamoeba invadens IP1]|eukprot:XP_004256762.1 charged multivesicular body protein, putative [Entamoeba invadens IP1]
MLNRFIGKKDVVSVDETRATLESRSESLSKKSQELDAEIRKNLELSRKSSGAESTRYRQKALLLLRQKKQVDQHRDMSDKYNMNLQNMQFEVEKMQDYQKIYQAMEQSNQQMQALSRQFDLNGIEDVQDKMANFAEDQNDFGEILMQDTTGMDEAALDDELAEMGDDMFDGDIKIPEENTVMDFPKVPSSTQEVKESKDQNESSDPKFAI